MKIIPAGFEFIDEFDGDKMLKKLEKIARVCYKSEEKISADSASKFIAGIIKSGHESVIEHEKITVRLICDRGVSHEIVRHRIASYSQESTRYCNYSKEKFGKELTFIAPCFWQERDEAYQIWKSTMETVEKNYLELIEKGASPQEARSILPNSLKTELVMTMNLREWRHFFKLRTAKTAHPQMREIACMMLKDFREKIPVVFDDIAAP